MRFSLQDVKKNVRGRDMTVSLHFLRSGELHGEIERLIAYYEDMLGQAQRQFSLDDARACIGDYRLAHCLIATLSNWYHWRPRSWEMVIQELVSPPMLGDISSPIQLRLALYTYVNIHYQGFLTAETRRGALQALAATWSLSVPDLEALLVLDSEEEAVLVRDGLPPAAQEVATLYNQWAFEAALFGASNVHFVIDCNAFSNVQEETQYISSSMVATGAGMAIKRLCYLAHKLGVYYDLAYEEHDLQPQAAPARLHLTLYGPQEVTGVPQQYGMRLARLCRLLLGYGVAKGGQGRTKKGHTLSAAIVEAEATVHFLQRAYTFNMDAHLFQLLPPLVSVEQNSGGGEATVFDSSIEQLFAASFIALASSQGVDGWRLEREPEPLLLASSIFIPDFALTRGSRRIYVEILGFWTPAYRERKIQKLQQLQDRNDLLLAIPLDAKDAFVSIAPYFPIVYYDGQLSVTQVLQMLHHHYDDFAERLELIDVARVRERVLYEGLLPERLCYNELHCYRRSELQPAAERVVAENVRFTSGIGLYSLAWLEQLKCSFIAWLRMVHRAALSEVLQEARERWPVLALCEDATIEVLLGLWPEVNVRRASIFEAVVEIVDSEEDLVAVPEVVTAPGTKKVVRERRAVIKKRIAVEQEATQGDLWG